MKPGDILEVQGDCSTFEKDIRSWCERLHKPLLSISHEERGRVKVTLLFFKNLFLYTKIPLALSS
jgi:TusA-related sulfurtransferase